MSEEEMLKKFDNEQLEIVLNDLQDIDKFTGFKDGAFKYELGKYQANLLVNQIKKYKEVIDRLKEYIRNNTLGFDGTTGDIMINEKCLFDILKEVK